MRAGQSNRLIPLWLKLAYTAFVAVHVAINWHYYGPLAFLWSCDIAVLTLALAIWTESRLLVSLEAVAILFPLLLWGFDLGARALLGHGHYPLGFAGYMFDVRVPRPVRMISTFHIWLPLVLVYLLMRLGYDRRAFFLQCLIVTVLMVGCRLISLPPPASPQHPAVNLNWVYGPSDKAPQTAMPTLLYMTLMILAYQFVIYLPTHLVLCIVFAPRSQSAKSSLPAVPVVVI